MKLHIKKWNQHMIILFWIIFSMQNFACLVDAETYLIPGLIKISDIGVISVILWGIWVYFSITPKTKINYTVGGYIIAFILLIVISSTAAFVFFKQPISYGIRSLRVQIAAFLLYFPITRLMQCGKLKEGDVIKVIFAAGFLELIIYTMQYALQNVVSFTYLVNPEDVRYGSARMRFPYLMQLIIGFFFINKFFTGKTKYSIKKIWYLCIALWNFSVLVIMCKHRTPTVALAVTLIIGIILWKKGGITKFFTGITATIIVVAVMNFSPMISSIIEDIQNSTSSVNNLSIRFSGQIYLLERLKDSFLFGFGLPNVNNAAAQISSGYNLHYYLVDVGVVGFAYVLGFSGILWLVFFWKKNLTAAYRLYRQKNIYQYLLYFIFETGNLYIGLHWFWYYPVPFVLMFTILHYKVWKLKNELLGG